MNVFFSESLRLICSEFSGCEWKELVDIEVCFSSDTDEIGSCLKRYTRLTRPS